MFNPELAKNYWLEITPHRLIATPVVIALIAILILINAETDLAKTLEIYFYSAAVILACIGGAYYASNSLMTEFVEKTWDQQRLSPLSPWTLTWGKLVGGTLFPWYGAILCLLGYLLLPPFYGNETSLLERLLNSFILIEIAVFVQALSILLSLNLANNPDRLIRYRRNHTSSAVLVAIIVAPPFLGLPHEGFQSWYGVDIATRDFVMLSSLCFAFWAVLGAYRLMRNQMQFQNGQLPWIAFNIFLMIYFPGLAELNDQSQLSQFQYTIAFGIGLSLFYMLFLTSTIENQRIRRCINAIKDKNPKALWLNTPLWATTYILTALCAIISTLSFYAEGVVFFEWPEHSRLIFISLLLFGLRDVLLWLGLSFGSKSQRHAVITIIYLCLLYVVVPLIIAGLDLKWLLGFFWPADAKEVFIIPVALEIPFVAYWTRKRWLRAGM
ncbi:MAG: hypothetical protein GKR93_16495 [Gammaproteobacteria bacterium]|nr:hypothetical protein [Gammaproteobacteria bacterium]